MKGVAADSVFFPNHKWFLERAARLVEQIQEPKTGLYRCHEVTRFVFGVLGHHALPVMMPKALLVDGNFAGVDHSWIRLDASTILDVYAVGRLPIVQLVDVGTPTLLRTLYIGEGEEFVGLLHGHKMRECKRTDIREDVVKHLIKEWGRDHHTICEMVNDVCWICGSDE